jgi:hypothetical protein
VLFFFPFELNEAIVVRLHDRDQQFADLNEPRVDSVPLNFLNELLGASERSG